MNVIHTILRKSLSTITYSWKSVFPTKGIPVLMYHRVNDDRRSSNLDVPIKKFEEQMALLAQKGYRTLSIHEFCTIISSKSYYNKKDRVILLTFDDGWKDNYTNAFPILKKFSFKATIFLVYDTLEEKEEFKEYLNKKDIFEMQNHGIDFGSHTLTHRELTTIEKQEAKREIVDSKSCFEKLLNKPVISFCYPRGKINSDAASMVSQAGYELAFTIHPGINNYGDNLLLLNRTEISGNDSLFDFKKKLAGAYDWLHRFVQKTSPI